MESSEHLQYKEMEQWRCILTKVVKGIKHCKEQESWTAVNFYINKTEKLGKYPNPVQYWGIGAMESSECLQLQRARALKTTQQYSKELVLSQHLCGRWKHIHFTFDVWRFSIHIQQYLEVPCTGLNKRPHILLTYSLRKMNMSFNIWWQGIE